VVGFKDMPYNEHRDCLFFIGLHMPNHAARFSRCMVSVNRLKRRKSDFTVGRWIMDSGAFTELSTHGRYRSSVKEYADQVNRWKSCGELEAAVTQDYMCESFILEKTGLTIVDHQRLTIERYDELIALTDVYIMPVLQGYAPQDYVSHVRQYGERLTPGMWVGVGSVCKRNSSPRQIENVLMAIKRERPDLRLHGFGIKKTALESGLVQSLLYSSDSMAWSYQGRKIGRGNDPEMAREYADKVAGIRYQTSLLGTMFIKGIGRQQSGYGKVEIAMGES